MIESEKIFVNNSTPTIQEEVITLRIENEQLKKELDSYKALDSHYDEIEEDSKRIAEENAELKKDKEWLDNTNNEQTEVILKLNEQIEKMKCCYNCKHINDSNTDYYCEDCKRFANETNIEKWELAE